MLRRYPDRSATRYDQSTHAFYRWRRRAGVPRRIGYSPTPASVADFFRHPSRTRDSIQKADIAEIDHSLRYMILRRKVAAQNTTKQSECRNQRTFPCFMRLSYGRSLFRYGERAWGMNRNHRIPALVRDQIVSAAVAAPVLNFDGFH
jgi:hypothetical protein